MNDSDLRTALSSMSSANPNNIRGENADQWQTVSSGPPNTMNSWPVFAHNPDYVDGDPLPSVTVFAICAT